MINGVRVRDSGVELSPAGTDRRGVREVGMGQLGFFDLNRRYESLTEKNDPLVAIAAMVPFESFRPKLHTALIKGELPGWLDMGGRANGGASTRYPAARSTQLSWFRQQEG